MAKKSNEQDDSTNTENDKKHFDEDKNKKKNKNEDSSSEETKNDNASTDSKVDETDSKPKPSVTERHWDGWPTKDTPNYLIPKMGEIPVSSTVHFQSVSMTKMDDGLSAKEMWHKLHIPLTKAVRGKVKEDGASLKIIRAIYGDFKKNFVPKSQPFDVAGKIREMVALGEHEILASNSNFGNPAPNIIKRLQVDFSMTSSAVKSMTVSQDYKLILPGVVKIINAIVTWTYKPALRQQFTHTLNVTSDLQNRINSNDLRLKASHWKNKEIKEKNWGKTLNPDISLTVEYTLDGVTHHISSKGNEVLNIPSSLKIHKAVYGELLPVSIIDITDLLSDKVIDGRQLVIRADESSLKLANPAPGVIKKLRVDYILEGVANTKILNQGERLELGTDQESTSASFIHQKYFEPEPTSIAQLARRLNRDGITTSDFPIASVKNSIRDENTETSKNDSTEDEITEISVYDSMEDALKKLLGIDEEGRLDPLEHAESDAMDAPAEGVILYHEQGWFVRGIGLGNLLHSVALAPGEVTQVAMTHWNHTTKASSTEQVSQKDSTVTSDSQKRSISEIQDAAMQEHQSGSSNAESSASSMGIGVSSTTTTGSADIGIGSVIGGIFGGDGPSASVTTTGSSTSIGTSHNVSSVVTRSSGDKSLSMESNQKINATTKRKADATRTRRASVVREVSQSEEETLTTRVVANYNHMHSLTMMYFEVVEVYSLKTRVVDAERVIFLPFKVREVNELVPKYRAVLIEAAERTGAYNLAEAIRHYQPDMSETKHIHDQIERIIGKGNEDNNEIAGNSEIGKLDGKISETKTKLLNIADKDTYDPSVFQTNLTDLENKRAVILNNMNNYKDLPEFIGGFTVHALQEQMRPIDREIKKNEARIKTLERKERQEFEQLTEEIYRLQWTRDKLWAKVLNLKRALELLENLKDTDHSGPFHDHKLFFNQAVWLKLSPGEVLSLARRRNTFHGQRLCEQIDPAPVAITGNYVAYRWRFEDLVESQIFKKQHVEPFTGDPNGDLATVQSDIAVPTGGVFGEAVLGEAVSAEKIDLSRFWNWQDSPIPILPTDINPLNATQTTMQDLSTEPGKLDESSAKLDKLSDLPAPSGFDALAQTMQAQVFRDMSGQSALESLAKATQKAASNSDINASKVASENLKEGLKFVSGMADKAIQAASIAAGPATGGASVLGSLSTKKGGGATMLGGVLNADGAGGSGGLLSKLGGKSEIVKGTKDIVVDSLTKNETTTTDQKSSSGSESQTSNSEDGSSTTTEPKPEPKLKKD